MQSLKILLLGTAVGLATGLPAAASSSVWYNSEGGKVRLVTSGGPDEAGFRRRSATMTATANGPATTIRFRCR